MASGSREILERAAAGDARARASLLTAHWSGLLAFVRRRLGRDVRAHETSVDLVQSICREALEELDAIDYRGTASFRRWLYACAENKLRDRGRHWRRDRRAADREVAGAVLGDGPAALEDGEPSPGERAAAREELERVERAFRELPEDHRRVILLARVEGLSHEAIAREMGRSVLASRSLLSRALARLALALEEGGGR